MRLRPVPQLVVLGATVSDGRADLSEGGAKYP